LEKLLIFLALLLRVFFFLEEIFFYWMVSFGLLGAWPPTGLGCCCFFVENQVSSTGMMGVVFVSGWALFSRGRAYACMTILPNIFGNVFSRSKRCPPFKGKQENINQGDGVHISLVGNDDPL
jgi:hypothetical protein